MIQGISKNYVCKNIEHGFTPLDNLVEQRLCNKNKISYGVNTDETDFHGLFY